jgi:hypothetical protein
VRIAFWTVFDILRFHVTDNDQVRLDAFAAALHWANATVGLDQAVKVIVGAADLTLDVQALAKAVQASDANAIGSAIGKVPQYCPPVDCPLTHGPTTPQSCQ